MEYLSSGDTLYAQVLAPESSLPGSRAESPGQTLVLLHPTPLHHGFWLPVAAELPGYRRVLPDLRGHGRSALGLAPSRIAPDSPALTVEQLAIDVLALLDRLEIPQAIFAGCSIGGYTLYELWRRAPGRVAGLIFSSSKPQSDNGAERLKRAEWIARMEPAKAAGASGPAPEFMDAMLGALLSEKTRHDRPDQVAAVRSMMEQVRPEAIQAIQRGLGKRPDARATARTVTVPSCVIAGVEDASSTPEDLRALHGLLTEGGSTSTYHRIDDAGHYGPFEQPFAVAALVQAFCLTLPA